jgi:hypothetical protein
MGSFAGGDTRPFPLVQLFTPVPSYTRCVCEYERESTSSRFSFILGLHFRPSLTHTHSLTWSQSPVFLSHSPPSASSEWSLICRLLLPSCPSPSVRTETDACRRQLLTASYTLTACYPAIAGSGNHCMRLQRSSSGVQWQETWQR